jgi:hypothetical protein
MRSLALLVCLLVLPSVVPALSAAVDYSGQNRTGANFAGQDLTGATLIGTNLTNAHLSSANLTNARLESAILTGATLTGATLTGARFNAATVWPAGFNPAAAGAVNVPIDLGLGLVAHYPFEGDANDATAYANHGVVKGATLTTDRRGVPVFGQPGHHRGPARAAAEPTAVHPQRLVPLVRAARSIRLVRRGRAGQQILVRLLVRVATRLR